MFCPVDPNPGQVELFARGRASAVVRAVPVVLDRAGALEVVEQDRLDVERGLDLVADDHPAARDLVLP